VTSIISNNEAYLLCTKTSQTFRCCSRNTKLRGKPKDF
jgi:hypothetical protein